jgi:predicted metalloprotease with PDZ domain
MKGELLWVYEGLTTYLGEILTPRSGLSTVEDYREELAMNAAALDNQYGRRWRPLEDTAVDAQALYNAGGDYANYRRGVEFYPEGSLIWLEADVTIRELSKGAKSLDDFCRAFFGGPGGAPAMRPYGFDDVVAALNAVQPDDWAAFFKQRLTSTAPHAPLGGIERAGWKLAYDGTPSEMWKTSEGEHKLTDLSYSLGFKVREDGTVADVIVDSPAQKAGLAPAVKLIAVNKRQFNGTLLREAVQATSTGLKTIELLVRNGEYFETVLVRYSGGEKFPHLVRDQARRDMLGEVIAPAAKR